VNVTSLTVTLESEHNADMKQDTSKLVIGLVIILFGLSLILRTAGVEFTLFFTGWWAVLMIVIAIISMVSGDVGPGNFALLSLGAYLFADQRNWIPQWFNSAYLIGAVVIGFGLLFIFGPKKEQETSRSDSYQSRSHSHNHRENSGAHRDPHVRERTSRDRSTKRRADGDPNPSYTAVFSGQDIRNTASDLDGCTLFALFGGLDVDFRDAVITRDIVIDATAFFGGIDLKLPQDVRVITRATPLFGGVDTKRDTPESDDLPTVTVRCLVGFGGIDIV